VIKDLLVSMRTAVLISGYLRSFKKNLPNFKEKILGKFENVDVYIHITNNEKNEDKYLNDVTDINFILNELNPISVIIEPNFNFSNQAKKNNLFNNWFKYYKLNNLKKSHEIEFGKYDLVIKYRPDMELISDIDFKCDDIVIPKDSKIDLDKLLNPNDNYICDIFAYGSSEKMDEYFLIYENIKDLLNKYGDIPETILYEYLLEKNIPYKLLDIDYVMILSECNVFAIAGDSGSGKSTLANILKKYFSNSMLLECDRYHKWERGNDNWKKFTHLNPESNFLTKMNQDIFDLKVGKDVYQVDYNHKTGEFTDKQLINSDSENIIVCGLHSLYTNNNNIYNLKIFIDTEEELKTKWKINRDVKERGYSLEKILQQIESRKDDYKKYILPQRNNSDIIVNFYEKDDVIGLKLFVNVKYKDDLLYKSFLSKGINFQLFINNNEYIVYDFNSYTKIDSWGDMNIPILGNYYDYIIYTIFHLNNTFK